MIDSSMTGQTGNTTRVF